MSKPIRRKPPLTVTPLPEFVTFAETAAWLAVSPSTLNKFVKEREEFPKPLVIEGSRVRLFRRSDLNQFAETLEKQR